MWKATIRGLLARKVRLALTALSVLLGVSFVAGTYVLTDTLDQSFQSFFRETVLGIDVVVRPRAPFGGDGERERVADATVGAVRQVAGVRSAHGFLEGYAQFVGHDGDSIQNGGAPTIGITWSQAPRARRPLHLVDGDRPRADHEVAMDVGTAREHGFEVGGTVDVLLDGPKERFTISGLFRFGTRNQPLAVTFAAFDLATAQRVFDAPGLIDAVNVVAKPGVDHDALVERIRRRLGTGFEVSTASEFAADRSSQFSDFFALLTQLLLGFAAIGLVVGGFIIFNTFAILVAQRTRELGLLRAMGARGRQVVVAVIVEAAIVGLLASALGLLTGIGLAAVLLAVVGELGFHVPEGALVIQDRTIVAALAVGTFVTVLSSVIPAVRAARIAPIAAINDVREERPRPFRRRRVIGTALVALSVPCLVIGIDRSRAAHDVTNEIWIVAVGALLLFLGVVVLLATFAHPFAGVLGRPLRALGPSGVLARENAMRNPRRTAATASALVVGLALVGLVAIFGESAKASVERAVDRGIRADFILKAQQFAGFSPQVAERLEGLPELDAVAAFRFGNVRVELQEETVAGVDPTQLSRVVDLRTSPGSIRRMREDGMLVFRRTAERYGLHPGDRRTIQFPRGFLTLRVAGIYDQEDFTGGLPVPFIVPRSAYLTGFGTDDQDSLVYVAARDGDLAAARAAIERALGDKFPNIDVLTRQQYKDEQERAIDRFLAVTAALLLLAEIVAVLGIINTLALSVYERTRELGLLRAVGTTRRQIRRMVRGESVVVALIGGLVGTAVGLVWGWVFVAALESQGITEVRVPVAQLVIFVALSMVAGVVAAVYPAWRAARLDVLAAIAEE
ncbi:MAG TPA: ABC transporter permease [Acidimicrobiia bacterium]